MSIKRAPVKGGRLTYRRATQIVRRFYKDRPKPTFAEALAKFRTDSAHMRSPEALQP